MPELDIRQMPYSYEAEQAVLGSVILDEALMGEIGFLHSEDFYLEQHKAIFSVMLQMYGASKTIDVVTLVDKLIQNSAFKEGDALKYIKMIVDSSVITANIKSYAEIVRSKAVLRKIIDISRIMSDKAFGEQTNAEELVDLSEQLIFDISKDRSSGELKPISRVVIEEYEKLEQISKDPSAFTGIKTGFSELDRYLVGMNPGDFIVVGARPGMGKTSFCLNIAANVAKSTKKEVAVFSLEMPAGQLVSRMLSSESGVDNYNMRTGKLSNDEWQRLAEASSALSETNILIDDTSTVTLNQIRSKLRRCKNLGLVVIDYLQLMTSTRDNDKQYENRVNEVAALTRGLKLMAMSIGVPIILCSQLNRNLEARNDKKPMLADLRESGSIEQDADAVMLLYKYMPQKSKNDKQEPEPEVLGGPVIAICEVAKNRHGEMAAVKMNWHGSTYRFSTISEIEHE